MNDFSNIKKNDLFNEIYYNCNSKLNSFWLGKIDYQFAWDLQKKIHYSISEHKLNGIILYLEHNPVYTFGKNANHNHLLPSYPKDADVFQIDRG